MANDEPLSEHRGDGLGLSQATELLDEQLLQGGDRSGGRPRPSIPLAPKAQELMESLRRLAGAAASAATPSSVTTHRVQSLRHQRLGPRRSAARRTHFSAKLGDDGEAREQAGEGGVSQQRCPGVEREGEARDGLYSWPTAAHEGAMLAVARAEEIEDGARSSSGRSAVVLTGGLGDGREDLRRRKERGGRRKGRGLATAQGGGRRDTSAAADLPKKGMRMGMGIGDD